MPGPSRLLLLAITLALGCGTLAAHRLNDRFGEPAVRDRTILEADSEPEYHRDVKPILDARCVVCHACWDAPCQLQLGSHAGIDRGASRARVYESSRLTAAAPTRLSVDADATAQWRQKGFFPVLNERWQTPEANREAGLLYRMLALKRDHPLPTSPILPETFDFSLNRDPVCTDIEGFDAFAEAFPQWGMPYGLPGLRDDELATMTRWIEAGAPTAPPPALDPDTAGRVEAWEAFWNGSSLKEQLAARYMYEHLFLADLYFEDTGRGEFFRLVRSSTPPGEPIADLGTRRPFDAPGVDRFWYRLRRKSETIVDKNHMPYALSEARMARWTELFLDADYTVSALPSYAPRVAANPFDAFRELPVQARYRFMLEEAQFTIMGFIKGPVCRGQVALDVINDHFWVVFVDPESEPIQELPDELIVEASNLRLPAEDESNALVLASWLKYARMHRHYLEERARFLAETFPKDEGVTLDVIWAGDGDNRNASLTVFRHFDSATVLKGMVGGEPKTAWVIGYSLLERIHYLLVAGFDVYGNVGHQIHTRLYMDFLRMEGETQFVALLPEADAERELLSWYRDAEDAVSDYLKLLRVTGHGATDVAYETDDPKHELYAALRARLGPRVVGEDPIVGAADRRDGSARMSALRQLAEVEGAGLQHLPEQSILHIVGDDPDAPYGAVFTLLANRAHTNVSSLFGEASRLRPDEYTVSVVPGIVGSYPNAFLRVRADELDRFARQVAAIDSEIDYADLLDRYGVRRTSEDFWAVSDWLYAWYADQHPIEAGRLDYGRFENR